MATVCGETTTVTLELADGTVFSGLAHVVQVEQSLICEGFEEWRMELIGLGEPLWRGVRKQAAERQREIRSAIEWACDYCGSIWPKATAKCVQCGGHRSFVYDV